MKKTPVTLVIGAILTGAVISCGSVRSMDSAILAY